MTNAVLSLLRRKVPRAGWPRDIGCDRRGDAIELKVTADAATGNMQENAAAVDGWALILLSLDPAVRVTIEVADELRELPVDKATHARRLGYRMDRFRTLFPDRISLGSHLSALTDRTRAELVAGVLNISGDGRAQDDPPAPGASEKAIELQLTAPGPVREAFKQRYGLVRLCLQFPVGLFAEQVLHATRLFPGGGARIDLIGVDATSAVHVFELKNRKNRQVGALSELLFYSWMLVDARGPAPRFRFKAGKLDAAADVGPGDVENASTIVARLLTHGCLGSRTGPHPLIDQGVFDLLNTATGDCGWPIRYGVASWDGLGVREDAAA